MIKLNIYLVTYDRLYDKVIEQLDENELETIKCYNVQKSVKKDISDKVKHIINEWELTWSDYNFQQKQYYEYGTIIHLIKNPYLLEGLTHIGLLHYDVIFNKNSVNDIIYKLGQNPDTIFYQRIRGVDDIYLTKFEVESISKFMSDKMNITIDPDYIWKNGWVSEALSVTPIEVFNKFGKFIIDNQLEIENILLENRWGIMNNINHRICGIIERMWGFYLVSMNIELLKMNVIHDWDSYVHKHCSEENWIKIKNK